MQDESRQVLDVAAQRTCDALDVAIDVLEEIQNVMSAGRPTAVKVRLGDKVVAELPLALTAGAAIAAGLLAVLLTRLTVEIEHEES